MKQRERKRNKRELQGMKTGVTLIEEEILVLEGPLLHQGAEEISVDTEVGTRDLSLTVEEKIIDQEMAEMEAVVTALRVTVEVTAEEVVQDGGSERPRLLIKVIRFLKYM
jgi:hypothetical protein